MGEYKERPPIREVAVTVKAGDEVEERVGVDLDDVVRALLWDLKSENGWSTLELSRQIGVPKSTLQSFLQEPPQDQEPKGTQLTTLTAACTAMKMSPVAFFQSYGPFSPEARATVRYAEDVVFDRFRTVLDAKEARELLSALQEAKRRGVLEEEIRTLAARYPGRRHRQHEPQIAADASESK